MKHISRVVLGLLLAGSARAQTISYLSPDAAAPGMAIYTEILGPSIKGNFGADGLNQVSLELVNPADALRMSFGPSVTSWDGRLISALVIVYPTATAGPVPFRVNINGRYSSADTFYIQQPQHLGVLAGGGALGSGGAYGTRSRRNTFVVDSLVLASGTFTVSDIDPDPNTPGNQAYLPFTIISKGGVRVAGTLSVDGSGIDGIAGGGGGGARDKTRGGNGFTGGGGMHGDGGVGSGGEHTVWNGGISLCGTPGAGGLGDRWFDDQGGGGGTGFPFGTGGVGGTWYQEGGNNPPGGIGGGSGGGERSMPDSSFGGGGGAYATNGGNSGTSGPNGGRAYGNALIVPFCGGSGGGGGNQFGDGLAGSGGAGGGAIHIIALGKIDVTGVISARGADGESTHEVFKGGGGGGGAGGAIALTAPRICVNGHLAVDGGKGGAAVLRPERGGLPGGDGGRGRIRVVGIVDCDDDILPAYAGPTVSQSKDASGRPVLYGSGVPGDSLVVYCTTGSGNQILATRIGVEGTWSLLTNGELTSNYVTVVEQMQQTEPSAFLSVPEWVISPRTVLTADANTASVTAAPSTEMNLAVLSQDNRTIQIHATGEPLAAVTLRLSDVMGKEVSRESMQFDGTGVISTLRSTSGLPSGTYVATIQSEHGQMSKVFQIIH